jgi:hypothetical protein
MLSPCKVKKPLEGVGIHSFTFVGMFLNPKAFSNLLPLSCLSFGRKPKVNLVLIVEKC